MRKLVVVLGVLVLLPGLALAQSYYVDYFANNAGPVTGAPDQSIRIINVGTLGTPLTSPAGDICADIYVFDNNQEMVACCAEQITPNELDSASVGFQLTNSPLTSVVPPAGVIKVVTTPTFSAPCDPTAFPAGAERNAGEAMVFASHLQVTGGATFVTETELLPSLLSDAEGAFLQVSCSFTRYLGSGKGICTSSVPGH